MPKNIIPIFLPPRAPELNPVENIWQFMRDNWLSNRIFEDYETIVDVCTEAWNCLIDKPEKNQVNRITPMGERRLINRATGISGNRKYSQTAC